MSLTLAQQLNPKTFEDYYGNTNVITLLKKSILTNNIPGAIFISGQSGSGKDQPVSEPVLTPNGWSTMGQLKVDDLVIGSNGLPTKVTHIFPQGTKDIYTVTTKDGVKIRCGKEHLWSVYIRRHGKSVLITETIEQLLNRGILNANSFPRYTLPQFQGLQNGLEVDYAYALGYCLGNGCFTMSGLKVSYDSRIESKVVDLLQPTLGQPTNSRNNGGNSGQSAYSWSSVNPEIAKYRNSGKSGDKHLLKEHSNWLAWNYNSRLELLKGLLDSDGCVGKNLVDKRQRSSFSSTSINLIVLVKDLVRSLGGRCCEPKADNRTYYKSGNCWSLAFRMPVCPFKLKADEWQLGKCSMQSTIASICKEDYQEESVCIKVDAADELYVTTGFKLTHNSSLAMLYIHSLLCLNRADNSINPCNKCINCMQDPRTSKIDGNVLWVQVGAGNGDTITTQMNEAVAEAYVPATPLSLSKAGRKIISFDECQNIPKDKLSQLLFLAEVSKVSEENNVTFIFQTMDESAININVLNALKSRCGAFYFNLKSPTKADIKAYLLSKFPLLEIDTANTISSYSYSYRSALQTLEFCKELCPNLDNKYVCDLLGFADKDIRKQLWQLLESCNQTGLRNYKTFKEFWALLENKVNLNMLILQLEEDIEMSLMTKPNTNQLVALDCLLMSKVKENINLQQSLRSIMGLSIIDYSIFNND